MTPVSRRDGVIPMAAWATAAVVFVLVFLGISAVLLRQYDVPVPIRVVAPIVGPLLLAGYVLLLGYVYGDARRRAMRYVMWTWLVILIPNGIGVILYFICRDPMPVFCSKCGSTMHPNYAYCPQCGEGVAPACGKCQRISQPGWSHCAYCGGKL